MGEALRLAESLGYDSTAMAELLPAAAFGLTQALMNNKENQSG